MAYNSFGYQYPQIPMPNYSQYSNVPPVIPQQQAQQVGQPLNATQQVQTQPQIQNGGFISVRSENEVLNYPVAPGNCVTFKIEGQPIVMEKSMGFSQLEAPHVERYRLVKEEIIQKEENSQQQNVFDATDIYNDIDLLKKEIKSTKKEIDLIKSHIENMKDDIPITAKRNTSKKKEDGDD